MASKIKLIAFDRAGPGDVLKLALSSSLAEFAREFGFSKQEVSQCLAGYRTHKKIRNALAKKIGVDRGEIDEVLGSARSREKVPA